MPQVKAIIHGSWNKYTEKFDFDVYSHDMSEYGYFVVQELELEVPELSDADLRKKAFDSLVAKKNKILADAWVQAQGIQDEAEKLLALPAPTEERGDEVLL